MQPFVRIIGQAFSLDEDNVDTDVIYPARFLTITAREGLGAYAFADRPFRLSETPVLVAGANFGCGSSREQAVWALLGAGVRCIIAPGFGEIFFGNCLRNGLLPVALGADHVAHLHRVARTDMPFTVDLHECSIQVGNGAAIRFAIAEPLRQSLLNGWDETEAIFARDRAAIDAFETRQRHESPWLWR
jgi:3-isopropylmalate/(R)-2-methylmalate dehydratase small subunit